MDCNELFKILEVLLNDFKNCKKDNKFDYEFLDEDEVNKLQIKCNAVNLDKITKSELKELLTENSNERLLDRTLDKPNISEILLNSICNPNIVKNIRQNMLKHFNK